MPVYRVLFMVGAWSALEPDRVISRALANHSKAYSYQEAYKHPLNAPAYQVYQPHKSSSISANVQTIL